jgi:hypothetical protein
MNTNAQAELARNIRHEMMLLKGILDYAPTLLKWVNMQVLH